MQWIDQKFRKVYVLGSERWELISIDVDSWPLMPLHYLFTTLFRLALAILWGSMKSILPYLKRYGLAWLRHTA